MQLVDDRPNVELRRGEGGGMIVVLAFPYDPHIVAVVRGIPQRRFDWDRREWFAPVDDWAGVHVAEVVDRFPELTTSAEVDLWLKAVERRWVGRVTTTRHDGRGWFVLHTRAGTIPEALREGAVEREDGTVLVPLTEQAADAIDELRSARVDGAAQRCVQALQRGEDPVPPARLVLHHGVDGERLKLDVLWDPDTGAAFEKLPGAAVAGTARTALRELRAEYEEAAEAIRRSRATTGEPLPEVAARMGGVLQPFQWAGVRYALDARQVFLADEQGLGKTVEALATLEADDAFPALVICPASLKLNWERETRRWLPHRSIAVVEGRTAVPPAADITILNYEIVASHREDLARRHPRALVVDES